MCHENEYAKKHPVRSLPGRSTHQQRPHPIHAGKGAERHQAFIREMNAFVAKYGTITDDEFFRVL